ncbi:Bug family tripartite tricarboxylate transporter substrate binding protein [Candidimonas nitroreducens]|uniref:ABC transporter substrate-binding protein n=1 Tax=Candidimonas nitroreducens TaxID=683354 RepID=A0A225MJT5_9BURK|nr:tripartite tricarboxylate transporter substrate binding protein [Candidimonas nitroreducens]OWT60180.1 ABC transporter substrate-binding protein [Candidimonas nitroreducens]
MKLLGKHGGKLIAVVAAGLLALMAGPANAKYPERPVTWVVPFPPGGPTDVASRVLAHAFEQALGQSFVVVNKPGASGSIGMRQIVSSKPDGYTIGTLAGPSLLAPLMLKSPPYDLTKNIQAVGLAYLTPLVLVVNSHAMPGVTDLKSLASFGRGKDLNYTSPATGSIGHLTLALILKELGLRGTHIGYQGSAPAVTAVVAGQVPLALLDSVAVLPQVKSGALNAIAVTIDGYDQLPQVKSLAQQGAESAKTASWGGLVAPRGLPPEALSRLQGTLQEVLKDPKVISRLKAVGAYTSFEGAAALQKRIDSDTEVWGRVIKENNLRKAN